MTRATFAMPFRAALIAMLSSLHISGASGYRLWLWWFGVAGWSLIAAIDAWQAGKAIAAAP